MIVLLHGREVRLSVDDLVSFIAASLEDWCRAGLVGRSELLESRSVQRWVAGWGAVPHLYMRQLFFSLNIKYVPHDLLKKMRRSHASDNHSN
jgi:hypothetical protein